MQNKQMKRITSAAMATILAASQVLSANIAVLAEDAEAVYCYGTMNIPYADYYYGELGNPVNTTDGVIAANLDLAGEAGLRTEGVYDAVTSATANKWRNMFASAAYSSQPNENGGGQILGVVSVPVAIEQELYNALTAEASNNMEYTGSLMQLFENFTPNADQSAVPAAYKELYADGTLSATIAEKTVNDTAAVKLSTNSNYGDYQLDVTGLDLGEDILFGVVVSTDSGNYGMLHLENIWRNGTEISWSAGIKTNEVHGNTLRSLPYEATSGAYLTGLTYLTNNGVYQVTLADQIYLPKKTAMTVTAESVPSDNGSIALSLENVPEDFETEVSVNGLENVSYADAVISYDGASTFAGQYQITVSDASGVYAPVSTNVLLTSAAIPAAFDVENTKLVPADGISEIEFSSYLKKLSAATINGTSYNLSGKRSVKLINTETGELDLSVKSGETEIFAESGTYTIVVTATGYTTPLEFEVTVEKAQEETAYVYGTVNLPYADYYYGELFDVTENAEMQLDAADPTAEIRGEGMYDAVTSATNQKSKRYGSTYFTENEETGAVTVEGIGNVNIAIPVSLYEDAKAALAENAACNNQLLNIIGSMTVNEDQNTVPTEYKVLNGDGTLTSMVDANEAVTVTDATIKVSTNTMYGNYQIGISEADSEHSKLPDSGNMEGVIITTTDGSKYAMLHVDNLWLRTGEMAWAVRDNYLVHNANVLKYKSFVDTVGKTISSVKYIIRDGADVTFVGEAYLPVLHDATASVASTEVTAGELNVTLTDLPEDFAAEASCAALGETSYADGVLHYDAATANPGNYTVTVADANGVYAPMNASVVLTTDAMPAAYDAERVQIIAADGAAEDDYTNYLSKISKISVNGKEYSVAGRGAVKLLNNKTGELDLTVKSGETEIFAESGTYTIVVTATGYTTPLEFEVTVEKAQVVEMRGDANGNGIIEVEDAIAVLSYYANISAGNEAVMDEEEAVNVILLKNADVNNDNVYDVSDAVKILNYYAKLAAGMEPDWED